MAVGGYARRMKRTLRTLCLLSVLFTSSSLPADDWPQFRGPNASGVSRGTKSLPVKFSSKENVLWSTTIGKGVACLLLPTTHGLHQPLLDFGMRGIFGQIPEFVGILFKIVQFETRRTEESFIDVPDRFR